MGCILVLVRGSIHPIPSHTSHANRLTRTAMLAWLNNLCDKSGCDAGMQRVVHFASYEDLICDGSGLCIMLTWGSLEAAADATSLTVIGRKLWPCSICCSVSPNVLYILLGGKSGGETLRSCKCTWTNQFSHATVSVGSLH